MSQKENVFRFLASIIICLLAGVVGSIFTSSSLESWYPLLEKPALNPPSRVFFPVWTALYILMGISLFLMWKKGLQEKEVRVGFFLFGLQLGLNIFWSFLFFGLQSPYLAFLEILLLWLAILLTVIQFWKVSKTASYLLIPYLLWVSFAVLLNYQIWVLNT
ncbi:TPA: TspO/MBR family protein [Methanosarcina acetivorans]|uniref:Benzodiazepine receptor TspO n=2 Tax=Methanosarcina acetivorans TaxID=2214 RepID=Q8TID9_METAC|nr:TspO/MBR family protein [Methanosarcina acetivorans]AAM07559.1 benzodiazepine receptor TspO [Methanosarcina acetivorans C2A]HIH92933.1 TspO/MBR family protein [Methanosarcina acetivorans]